MAVRGRGSLKFLQDNATLSKKELEKMEKDAERRTADRKKLKESGKKAPSGTRRAKVQARRAATNSIPKAVRNKMISPAQDAQNKKDEKLRTQNRRGPSKKGVEQAIKTATDKAKSGVKAASKVGALSKAMSGLGALFYSAEAGKKGLSDVSANRGRGDGKAEVKQRRADAGKKSATSTKAKNYNVGVSKGGVSFKEAFAHFRKKGAKTFTWNGKKYTTEIK